MRLNEYPKEELKTLLADLMFSRSPLPSERITTDKWIARVKEAIRDAEFKEKELPFNKPNNSPFDLID